MNRRAFFLDNPKVLAVLAVFASALPGVQAAEAHAKNLPPKNAKELHPIEVIALYRGKTWQWETGGGYFAADRKFFAVAGSGKDLTYATGKWIVTENGSLCFIADWHDRKGVYRNTRSCFNHASADGKIYQASAKSGKWYLFKNRPAAPDDEFNKLKSGDLVSGRLAVVKKLLPAN